MLSNDLFWHSAITLILDSVPDFLTKILPLPFINLLEIFIAFFTDNLSNILASLILKFTNTCGVFLNTSKNLLALVFLFKAFITSKATKRPSPVVANFPRIICPDCSPPRLNFFFLHKFFYKSITHLCSNKFYFFSLKKFCKSIIRH